MIELELLGTSSDGGPGISDIRVNAIRCDVERAPAALSAVTARWISRPRPTPAPAFIQALLRGVRPRRRSHHTAWT